MRPRQKDKVIRAAARYAKALSMSLEEILQTEDGRVLDRLKALDKSAVAARLKSRLAKLRAI